MPTYSLRRATVDDIEPLIRHRIQMFADMGWLMSSAPDAVALASAYRRWLLQMMPIGSYVSWVVESDERRAARRVVAGGGITIIPWPPGPVYPGSQLAFAYNVYTEPEHRRRGLARQIMDAIHAFCRDAGISSVALNASTSGQPLYESMGYRVTDSPMMFLSLR